MMNIPLSTVRTYTEYHAGLGGGRRVSYGVIRIMDDRSGRKKIPANGTCIGGLMRRGWWRVRIVVRTCSCTFGERNILKVFLGDRG